MNLITLPCASVCMVLCVWGCSRGGKPAQPAPADIVINLGSGGVEDRGAAEIFGALRTLVESAAEPLRARFLLDDEAIAFEVLAAEPREAYAIHRISPWRRSEGDGWIVAEPLALPPGGIDLDWIDVSSEQSLLRGRMLDDLELSDWLQSYSKNLSSVGERSALVVAFAEDADTGRLFEILQMLSAAGLDRFLIERLEAADPHPERESIRSPDLEEG